MAPRLKNVLQMALDGIDNQYLLQNSHQYRHAERYTRIHPRLPIVGCKYMHAATQYLIFTQDLL